MSKKYELVFIIQPEKTEKEALSEAEKIKKTLEKTGAKVVFDDFWGKRDLAYAIQKHNQGYYQLFELEIDTQKLSEVDNELNLAKNVIRHLVTAMPDDYETKSFKDFAQDEPVAKKPVKKQVAIKKPSTKAKSKPVKDDQKEANEKLDKMLSSDFDV